MNDRVIWCRIGYSYTGVPRRLPFFLGLLLVSGLPSDLLPGSEAELLGRMPCIEEAQPGGMSWAATLGLWFLQR